MLPWALAVDCESWNSRAFFEQATEERVAECLAAGAEINAVNDYGFTPLHLAAKYSNDPGVTRVLLDAGANGLARDEAGRFASYYTSKREGLHPIEAAARNFEMTTLANSEKYRALGSATVDFERMHPLVVLMTLWFVVLLIGNSLFWRVIGRVLVLSLLAYVPFWLALGGERLAASLVAVGAGLAGGAIYIPRFWRGFFWLLKWLGVLALILLFVVGIATANNTAGAVLVTLVMVLWWAWPWLWPRLRERWGKGGETN